MTPAAFRALRQDGHLSIRQAAAFLECSTRSIKMWENGTWPVPERAERIFYAPCPTCGRVRKRRKSTDPLPFILTIEHHGEVRL